jgi:hypothetical protein
MIGPWNKIGFRQIAFGGGGGGGSKKASLVPPNSMRDPNQGRGDSTLLADRKAAAAQKLLPKKLLPKKNRLPRYSCYLNSRRLQAARRRVRPRLFKRGPIWTRAKRGPRTLVGGPPLTQTGPRTQTSGPRTKLKPIWKPSSACSGL